MDNLSALLAFAFIFWQAKLFGDFLDRRSARKALERLAKARAELDDFRRTEEQPPEPAKSEQLSPIDAALWARIVLGVSMTASADEIKLAYRRLRSKHHTDRNGDAEKFVAVQRAYKELTS